MYLALVIKRVGGSLKGAVVKRCPTPESVQRRFCLHAVDPTLMPPMRRTTIG
jgi:hypothetical protein